MSSGEVGSVTMRGSRMEELLTKVRVIEGIWSGGITDHKGAYGVLLTTKGSR